MSVEFIDEQECWKFIVVGRFDKRNNVPEVVEKLADIPDSVARIVFDFEGVTHLMNDGLTTVIKANDLMNERKGEFVIDNASFSIMRVLRMNGLDALASVDLLASQKVQ